MAIGLKSQSALEYMMTYGWAILIIVIVAAVLYSLGIFSPSSSISATVTGFSNLGSVAAQCTANGVLRINLGDSTGYPINVTGITAKDSSTGQISTFKSNSTVDPNPIIDVGGSYIFSVPNVCPPAGTHYSISTTVNYTEPGQPLPGPYQSSGVITGTTSSTGTQSLVSVFTNDSSQQIVVSKEFFQDNTFSIFAWIYFSPQANLSHTGTSFGDLGYAWSGPGGGDKGFGLFSRSDHWYLNFYGDDLECSVGPVTGEWYLFGATWNKATKNQTIYVNGKQICTRTSGGYLNTSSDLYIGSAEGTWDGDADMYGYIANLQIYNNTALTPSQVNSLYLESLGGLPLSGNGIVGYWPLNGTAKDYSGNNNNGVASNVIYTSDYSTIGLP